MPICKQCHARITKFDRDICPICGCVHPLDGEGAVSSDTVEFTNQININNPEFKKSAPRLKKNVFLYFALIGWTGFGFSYLRFKKVFVVLWLLLNLAIIGGLGALLCFLTPLIYFGFILSLAAAYLINFVIGLIYKLIPNMKDGIGEFIL